jgi:hypothetical protein
MPHDRRTRAEEISFLTGVPLSKRQRSELRQPLELGRSFDEVLQEWRTLMGQVRMLVNEADKARASGALQLDEMEVSIGFSATGKVALLAEATAEASVTLTFKPPKPGGRTQELRVRPARVTKVR